MADQFTAAQTAAAEQKRALLSAMATGGTAAADAYKAAQADTSAARQQAVQQALAAAAQRNAPAALQSQLSSTISAPFDRENANLGQAAASRTASLSQIAAANGAYMDQAAAAAPVMRAATDHLLAGRRQLIEAELAQQRQAAAEKAAAKAEADANLHLKERVLGAAQRELEQNAAEVQPNPGFSYDSHADFENAQQRRQDDAGLGREAVARKIAVREGMDPDLAYGMFPDPSPTAAEKAKSDGSQKPHIIAAEVAGQKLGLSAEQIAEAISRSHSLTKEGKAASNGETDASPFQDAIDKYKSDAGNVPFDVIDTQLADGFVRYFGHDYPQLRALVRAMYDPSYQ